MTTTESPALAPRGPRRVPNRTYRDSITRLVKSKLLNELRLNPQPVMRGPRSTAATFSAREIAQFADLTLLSDDRPALDFIERALATRCSIETIYLDLLQPAARHLHERWLEDTCDFAAVTLGLCQLHHLVRELSSAFHDDARRFRLAHQALLTPAANEQHSFGLVMVGEFLRRDGWLVSRGPFTNSEGLGAAVRNERFTLVGLSLSCDSGLGALAAQIKCVRRDSLNRSVRVIVGGRVFIDRPELGASVGADATAADARQAVMLSRGLAAAPEDCHA